MTSSEDHFRAAEKFLEEAESHQEPDTRAEWCLELAKLHLALSQASRAASPRPSRENPQSRSLPDHTAPDPAEGQAAPNPVNTLVDPRSWERFQQGSRVGRSPHHDSEWHDRRGEAQTNPASHPSDLLRPRSETPYPPAFQPSKNLSQPDDEPK
jgi:hypothetical protein